MDKLFLLIPTLLLTSSVYGQKSKSIELDLIGRYDKHADYTTRFGERSYTNDTKLWGKSFGFNINYFHSLNRELNAKFGVGYYNLGIDKIRQTTAFDTISTGRTINYRPPSGILPLFATDKYHYDNLNFTLGLLYERPIGRKLNFIAAGDFNYLFSFSQLYRITYDDTRYRTNNDRGLGFAANSYLGILKKLNHNNNYISPKIIIPVYQHLRGDQAFGEDESVKMNKWFNGIGLSVAIGKYF